MINQYYIFGSTFRRFLLPFSVSVCLLLLYFPVNAQEKPPKPIVVTVRNYQPLTFGTFIQSGNYGTVIVSSQGARSATGSVIIPNINSIVTAALYDIEAIPGTLITIQNGTDATLTGSNGGSMTLQIGDSFPKSPFITTGAHTQVTIGGTLTVGSLLANPAGTYGGSFDVIFIQQ